MRTIITIVVLVIVVVAGFLIVNNTDLLTAAFKPPIPTNLKVEAVSSSQVTLSWTDPLNGGKDDEQGFNIERSANGSSGWVKVGTVGTGVTTYINTGLSANTTYYYRVNSYKQKSVSLYSNVASTTTANGGTTPPPPPPTGDPELTGTVIGTSGSFNGSGATREKVFDNNTTTFFDAPSADGAWVGQSLGSQKQVTSVSFHPRASWANRMVGGKFQGSNTADFTGTVIDLYTVSSAPTYSMVTVPITSAYGFTYVRYIGPNGSYGNVAEVNFFGKSGGTSLPPPPPTAGPNAPTNLIASAGSAGHINLSWNDNATNESGFKIERSVLGGSWSQIDQIGPNVLSYTNSGLQSNMTYDYRVRAFNSGGDSAYTNVASATTQSGSTPQSGVTQAKINLTNMQTSGMAPFTVHVNAIGSTVGSGGPHTAEYKWNFDNTNQIPDTTITVPDSTLTYDPEHMRGFNAAFTYDKPGTYEIELLLTADNGVTSPAYYTVTVTPDTRLNICVTGNASATTETETPGAGRLCSVVVTTAAQARSTLASVPYQHDTAVLFKGGETFNLDGHFMIDYNNVVLDSYGTGKATLMRTTANCCQGGIGGASAIQNTTIQNLIFDSVYSLASYPATISYSPISMHGRSFTVRDNEFKNVGYAINSNGDVTSSLVQNNKSLTGQREYFVWTRGSNLVIRGNHESSILQHSIRGTIDKVNISDNHLRARSNIWAMQGQYLSVVNNTLDRELNTNDDAGPAGFHPNNGTDYDDPSLRSKYGIFELNRYVNRSKHVFSNREEFVTVRNNTFNSSNRAIEFDYVNGTEFPYPPHDIVITGNTATASEFMGTHSNDGTVLIPYNVTVKNNTFNGQLIP